MSFSTYDLLYHSRIMKFGEILFVLFFFFISCSQVEDPGDSSADSERGNSQFMELNNWGFPLKMVLPADLMVDEKPEVTYDDGLGVLNIRIGEDFHFNISEDDIGLGEIKNELLNDQLFSYKFYDEGDQALLYQAVLPNGKEYFFHYTCKQAFGDSEYLITTDKASEFSLQNINLMRNSINSLSMN